MVSGRRWPTTVAISAVSFLLCLSQAPAQQRSQAEADGLRGRVRSVLTEGAGTSPDGIAPSQPASLVTYDHEGTRIDEVAYKQDGSILSHQVTQGKGWQPTQFTSEGVLPILNYSEIFTADAQGKPQERFRYDGEGKLVSRTVYSRPDACTKETVRYDADGKVLSRYLEKADPKQRTRTTQSFEGEVLRRTYVGSWDSKRRWVGDEVHDGKGLLVMRRRFSYEGSQMIEDLEHYEKGKLTERQRNVRDTESRRVLRWETIKDWPGSYSRRVLENDDREEPFEEVTYGRDGSILSKTTYTYENDAHGNWIRQVRSDWEPGDSAPRITFVTERKISYY